MGDVIQLVTNDCIDLRMAMSQQIAPHAADAIEIAIALDIVQPNALRPVNDQ